MGKYQNILEIVLLTFGTTWLMSLIMIIGFSFHVRFFYVYTGSVALSLFIIPYLYIERNHYEINVNIKKGLSLRTFVFLLLGILLIWQYNLALEKISEIALLEFIIQFLVVSVSEEYLYRCCVQEILCKIFSFKLSTIIQSILFAFILHTSLPFYLNLFLRFPMGLLLTYIHKKNSLANIIFIHFSQVQTPV